MSVTVIEEVNRVEVSEPANTVTVQGSDPVILTVTEQPTSVTITQVVPRVEVASGGVQGVPGPPGADGLSGNSQAVQFTKTAATDLSGHRVVRPLSDGRVGYADNLTPDHALRPLWVTVGAASAGADVDIVAFGWVEEDSWSWDLGPVYLGTNGVLTQTPPVAPAFSVIIGYSGQSTVLFVDRQIAVILAY